MDRLFLISALIAAYAVAVAVHSAALPAWAHAAAVPFAIVLWLAARVTVHADRGDAARARTAFRLAAAGALIALAGVPAWYLPVGRALLSTGCGVAALASLFALFRMPSEAGLALLHRRPPSRSASLAVVGSGWLGAALLAWGAVFELAPLSSRLVRAAFVLAALASLSVTTAAALLESRRRALELGAADRLRSFATTSLALLAIAVAGGALGLVALDALLGTTLLGQSLLLSGSAVTKKPETIGRRATEVVLLATMAVLPSLLLAFLAKARPNLAPLAVGVGCGLAALAGLLAPRASRALLPRTEPWTQAFEAATRAAAYPDPEPALERALLELSSLSLGRLEAPCLFRCEPPSVTSVDRAGYAITEPVTLPEGVFELARREPEAVLSVDVLRALAVREPNVRPVLAWLEDRHLHSAAVVLEGDVPIGMLAVPVGARERPLTLAEARAMAKLAALLSAQIAASAKLSRSLARETAEGARRAQAEARLRETQAELEAEQHRGEALTRVLAERALTSAYSPSARICIEALEQRGSSDAPLALLLPPGCDPLPYVAVYHLASRRKSAALYVIDGGDKLHADLTHWRDEERSPLRRARGGTLAILDPQLLPKLVLAYLGSALDDRVGLALVVPRAPDALLADDVFDERLADRLEGATVRVPALSERPEDLRPMVLSRLARLGKNLRGEALGIEPAAMSLLLEHDFPGNDAELDALLVRAVLTCQTNLVRRRDLALVGFSPERDHRVRFGGDA